MGTRIHKLLGKLKIEEDVEIQFFGHTGFNTPTCYDIMGKGVQGMSDERLQQLHTFARAVLDLHIEAYNKP